MKELECPNCKGKCFADYWKTMQDELDPEEFFWVAISNDEFPKWECRACHHRWGERDE